MHITTIKPALKHHNDDGDDDDESMASNSSTDRNSSNSGKPRATKKKKKNNKKSNKGNNQRTLKWDEDKIREHDQLRGTRMKIEEANTPFAYYDSGSETDGSFNSVARGNKRNNSNNANSSGNRIPTTDGISWDALTNKLEAHAAVKDKISTTNTNNNSSPSCSGHTTDEDNGISNTSMNTTTIAMNVQPHQEQEYEHTNLQRELERQELKRLEFQEHRKRHYNEMEVLRRFRRDHPGGEPTANGHQEEDDYDDDNDGDDENE